MIKPYYETVESSIIKQMTRLYLHFCFPVMTTFGNEIRLTYTWQNKSAKQSFEHYNDLLINLRVEKIESEQAQLKMF